MSIQETKNDLNIAGENLRVASVTSAAGQAALELGNYPELTTGIAQARTNIAAFLERAGTLSEFAGQIADDLRLLADLATSQYAAAHNNLVPRVVIIAESARDGTAAGKGALEGARPSLPHISRMNTALDIIASSGQGLDPATEGLMASLAHLVAAVREAKECMGDACADLYQVSHSGKLADGQLGETAAPQCQASAEAAQNIHDSLGSITTQAAEFSAGKTVIDEL